MGKAASPLLHLRPMVVAMVVALLPGGAKSAVPREFLRLVPDGPPAWVRRFWPAGGPLERFTGNAGSWYALLLVPSSGGWPMELAFQPPSRRHDVRLTALDVPPGDQPAVAVPIEVRWLRPWEGSRAQPVARFVMPEGSRAHAFFVLLELRRPDGMRPSPLWVRLQSQQPGEWIDDADANGSVAPGPESPLSRSLRDRAPLGTLIEMPGAPEGVEEGEAP